ncbi:MAG: helix-turn-helix domain-containing protein, partial [Oscillospiraceae bacterium]|nr:helix-turn-helix domain-containing protein [Oscillospiraceae bacterium]
MPIGAEQRYYLKLKAVYYYYEKDYTQTEIAQMLNVSRITLGKLLKEAREEGMVKIDIVDQRNVKKLLELEARLRDRFGLADVKVVDCVE